jgi:2-oxoglutarate/2-oxoacid ferredoxin oxidoreductase subunit beta
MHDGGEIRLRKLDATHDFSSRGGAFAAIDRHRREGEIATGLLYVDAEPADLHKRLGTAKKPLNQLSENDLCPGADALAAVMASLR